MTHMDRAVNNENIDRNVIGWKKNLNIFFSLINDSWDTLSLFNNLNFNYVTSNSVYLMIAEPSNLKTNNLVLFSVIQLEISYQSNRITVTDFLSVHLTLILPEPKVIILCHQYRVGSACTSVQSDQALYCLQTNKFYILISPPQKKKKR